MNRRRRTLLLALALVMFLIVFSLRYTSLWPAENEASRFAASIKVGTPMQDIEARLSSLRKHDDFQRVGSTLEFAWTCSDGSILVISYESRNDCPIVRVGAAPPPPVPLLTRLRRDLARVFPFLKE